MHYKVVGYIAVWTAWFNISSHISGELLAVYTPERPVTSCEVTSGGHLMVLALRGRSHITTLKLRGPQVDDSVGSEKRCYGRPENVGKTFDLREEAQAAERWQKRRGLYVCNGWTQQVATTSLQYLSLWQSYSSEM